MSAVLTSRVPVHAWACRTAWALGRPVILRLDERAFTRLIRGTVVAVSPSDSFVVVEDESSGETHVPLECVLSVTSPHFHDPGRWMARSAGGDVEDVPDGQLGLVAPLPVGERGRAAMARAAASMLRRDLIWTLASLDRAGRLPETFAIASEAGRSVRWARSRLRELEGMGYVESVTLNRERRWRVSAW